MNNEYLDAIKRIPIDEHARRRGFTVIQLGGRYSTLREHDSVRIDRNKNCYYQNSNGQSGSIIDFEINLCGASSPKEAISNLSTEYGIERGKEYHPTYNTSNYQRKPVEPARVAGDVAYPQKVDSNYRAKNYLLGERKIAPSVVRYFVSHQMLYQDVHNNCVFKTDKFACMRSTCGKPFKIDAKGCDYNEGFFFKGKDNANKLFVSEGVIDIMSVMSLMDKKGERFTDNAYLALGGVGKADAIFHHLDADKNIKSVSLCFDNDEAGKLAYEAVAERLKNDYPDVSFEANFAPNGKDWNDYLKSVSDDKSDKMSFDDVTNKIAEKRANDPVPEKANNARERKGTLQR